MKKSLSSILIIPLFLSLFSGCAPAVTPTQAAPTAGLPAATATPQPTAAPTPAPTPTTAPVQIDLPVTQIAFEKWIETNPDGTFTSHFQEDYPDDGVFNAPESPSYIWNINPYSGLPIDNIIVRFDIHATKGAQILGFERGALVQLYNLNTVMDGGPNEMNVIGPMGIIRHPNFGENMERYAAVQSDAAGVRHYTVTIPYEQFLGGKTRLAVQFLPGTLYSAPTVSVQGFELKQNEVLQVLAAEVKPRAQQTSWLDKYWDGSCSLDYGPEMETPHCFDVDYSGGFCQILAAEYGLEDTARSEVVLYPGQVETTLDCVFPADEDIARMRESMINPQTGLVYGVWDYDAPSGQQLIASERVSSNLLIVSGYGYGNDWDMTTYQDPQSEAFLHDLLIKAIDREIVQAPNGKWVYAPGGINAAGEMRVALDDLSIMIQELYKKLRQSDLQRADRLLEGYANTLQLVLEAQERTPANLLPNEIVVKFGADGSYDFVYNGDFDMGGRFYFFWTRNYEWYGNGLQAQIDNRDIFDAGKLQFFSEMSGEKRDFEFRQLYEDGKRFDNVQRIPFYIYKIFYNIYSGSDGSYTRYYSLTDHQPIYKTYDSDVPQWEEFREHYGSITALVNWVQLAAFFNDESMLAETYPNLIKSMSIVQRFLLGADKPANISPPVWLAEQGLGKRDLAYFIHIWNSDYMRVLRGTNAAPWGMNGPLAWRVTFDELIAAYQQQYNVDFAGLIDQE